jgi:four helix bundle protein
MLRRSNFRDLLVWQKSKLLCLELYALTNAFLSHEQYGMTSQIRRAAVSMPTNIAEGHGRNSNADFARFLYVTLGSIRELETLTEIAFDLAYLQEKSDVLIKLDELAKMVSSFIKKLGSS